MLVIQVERSEDQSSFAALPGEASCIVMYTVAGRPVVVQYILVNVIQQCNAFPEEFVEAEWWCLYISAR